MGYSFYEIYITAQRAFRAMGFPFGADEDAGFIIAWLELNKFNGASLLQDLINNLDQKYDGAIKIKNLNENIDFKNCSILMKGPGLVDYIHSVFNNNKKIDLNITNCDDGIFFLPLLYKISKKINSIKFYICNSIDMVSIYQIKNNEIRLNYEKNINKMQLNQIRIKMDKDIIFFEKPKHKIIISEKIIQKNLSYSLSPNKKVWNNISKIANKTFVPESEESRNKGAGGGDAND